MQGKTIAKYFLHGVMFSLLWLLVIFRLLLLWLWFGVRVSVVGILFGLGLLFLVFVLGRVNTLLGERIWSFEMKRGMRNMFLHGFVLSMWLLIVNPITFLLISGLMTLVLPFRVLVLLASKRAIYSAIFIINAFIDGFMGKVIASWFVYEPSETNKAEKDHANVWVQEN